MVLLQMVRDPADAPEGLDDIVEDKNLADHLSLDSRPASRLGTPKPAPPINPVLMSILQQERNRSPVGVEEVSTNIPTRDLQHGLG